MNMTDLVSSLQKYWVANGPLGETTTFSGTKLDLSQASSWVEFWINQLQPEPQRVVSRQQIRLTLDIHIFSRENNKRAIHTLVDDTRSVMGLRSIPITTEADSSAIVGHVRCSEPIVRDFSRAESIGNVNPLQHQVVSFQAVATELPSPH